MRYSADGGHREYIERIGFYQQPRTFPPAFRLRDCPDIFPSEFTCEVTGKTGLTFFEALASEREEALAIHRVFPPPLKTPILKSVQFGRCPVDVKRCSTLMVFFFPVVEGRLDDLVDRVWDRFAHRFYPNESESCPRPFAHLNANSLRRGVRDATRRRGQVLLQRPIRAS